MPTTAAESCPARPATTIARTLRTEHLEVDVEGTELGGLEARVLAPQEEAGAPRLDRAHRPTHLVDVESTGAVDGMPTRAIAASLTDEDMANLAAYYGGQNTTVAKK